MRVEDPGPVLLGMVREAVLGGVNGRRGVDRSGRQRPSGGLCAFFGRNDHELEILGRLHQVCDPLEPLEIRGEPSLGPAGGRGVGDAVQSLHPEPHDRGDRPARRAQEDQGVRRDRGHVSPDRLAARWDEGDGRPIGAAELEVRQDRGEVPEDLSARVRGQEEGPGLGTPRELVLGGDRLDVQSEWDFIVPELDQVLEHLLLVDPLNRIIIAGVGPLQDPRSERTPRGSDRETEHNDQGDHPDSKPAIARHATSFGHRSTGRKAFRSDMTTIRRPQRPGGDSPGAVIIPESRFRSRASTRRVRDFLLSALGTAMVLQDPPRWGKADSTPETPTTGA